MIQRPFHVMLLKANDDETRIQVTAVHAHTV